MRKITSQIPWLEANRVDSVKKTLLTKNLFDASIVTRARSILLGWLLGVNEGVVYVFTFSEKLFGERVLLEKLKHDGFIETYGEGTIHCDYPKFNYFGISFFIEKDSQTNKSWGYTLPYESKELAVKKALVEALERQATYYLKTSTTTTYPKLDVGDASFLYDLIPKFTSLQLSERPRLLRKREDFKKVTGFRVASLIDGKKKFLPMDSFYWGKKGGGENEFLFQDLTSSGSGGGRTKEEAVLSALYELIERDLFKLFWFSGVKPPMIIPNGNSPFFDYLTDARERFNLEIHFFDTSYDIEIFSCVCIIVDPVLHIISTGAKVGFDGEGALKGAFLEALAMLSTIRGRNEFVSEDELQDILKRKPFCDIRIDRKTRANLYCSPLGISMVKSLWIDGNTSHVSFGDYNRSSKKFPSKKQELSFINDQFKKLVREKGEGYHVYVHTFSSRWTKMLGYHVAHAFVPSFLKLHLTEAYAAPVSERLSQFASKFGVAIDGEKGINPLPHFFP